MKSNEKKAVIGIKLTLLLEAKQNGYDDINDYIDALKEQIIKLQNAKDFIQNQLQKLTAENEQLHKELDTKNEAW